MLECVYIAGNLCPNPLPTNMKPLPSETCLAIITLLMDGKSCHHIAQKLHVGHSTGSELCSHLPSLPQTNPGGRPHILTPHDNRHLVHLVTSGQADNAR